MMIPNHEWFRSSVPTVDDSVGQGVVVASKAARHSKTAMTLSSLGWFYRFAGSERA